MNLDDLLCRSGIRDTHLRRPQPITGLAQRSDDVVPGDLFICRRGASVDGHEHAPVAIARGAAAVVVDHRLPLDVPQVVVADTTAALAALAAAFWDHPSRSLDVIGVTGTNGKTTTTFLIQALLRAAGRETGVIGTLSSPLTTPEPIDLQRRLADFAALGCRAVAMEVSSHGLVQRRVDHTWFAAGVFTNLDRDHLDHHGDMTAYFEAKAGLFRPDRIGVGIVNRDDPWGRRLLRRGGPRLVGYSATDVSGLAFDASGSRFEWRGQRIRLPLVGPFNVANALAAAVTAAELGVPEATIAAALSEAVPPPGRMEAIDDGQSFRLVVDCAHTPSALRQVIDALRPDDGRLIVVFGCGGDRDRTKRAEMGAIVADRAHVGILTTDNPRSEPVDRVFADVLVGDAAAALLVVTDRRQAIRHALTQAAPGDVVLVAGKGDQTVQQLADGAVPFDDRMVARELLAAAPDASDHDSTVDDEVMDPAIRPEGEAVERIG